MSTATLDHPRTSAERDTAPDVLGLMKVELRKMVDTRAGSWLLLGIAAVTVLVAVLMLVLGDAQDRTVRDVMEGTVQPAVVALPIVDILLVTSEWSQRTHLSTFALVPDRLKVILAKAGAALVLSVIAVLAVRAITTVAVLVSERTFDGDVLKLPWTALGQHFLLIALGMLSGIAFGALLLSSAPAIVLYFVLPTVFAALGSIEFLRDAAEWLDTSQTLTPLAERSLDGEEWAQVGTSMLLWLALPLAVGVQRIRRAEIN